MEYYDFKGKKLNSIGTLDKRILSFSIARNEEMETLQFLKVFPITTSELNNEREEIYDMTENVKSTGSGFIISKNFIATNYHVIEHAEKIHVVLNINGIQEEFNAKILSTDKLNDIAILSIKDVKFSPLPDAPYSIMSNTIDVGTSVFTMGHPLSNWLGKDVKITDGIISSKTGYEGDAVTYQITAPIQPGNSGGALFDKKGHLVGITNAGIPSAENVGYAIKSPYLLNLIDSAPISIELPRGKKIDGDDLTSIIKLFTPYIAFIKTF